jgi:hypothetical protein
MPRRLSWALVANTAVTAAVLLNGFPSIASADTAAKAVRGNQAASPSWTGSWNTVDAAGNKILMKLSQKGSTATGTYSLCHGSIHATIVGKILKGTWSQSNNGHVAGQASRRTARSSSRSARTIGHSLGSTAEPGAAQRRSRGTGSGLNPETAASESPRVVQLLVRLTRPTTECPDEVVHQRGRASSAAMFGA